MRRHLWLAVTAGLFLTSCGSQDATVSDSDDTPTLAAADDRTEYTGFGTVLENAEHGPQLCLGAMLDSYPPQCGGPNIVGWSWEGLDGVESAGETTWGAYVVTGTYDGTAFTLTRRPAMNTAPIPVDVPPPADFSTPCEPPAEGWGAIDPARATDAALAATFERAQSQAEYAGGWIDQSPFDSPEQPGDDDPAASGRLVLNVRFTGDVERHERNLREIWGGALCVGLAEHSMNELAAIQKDLEDDANVLGTRSDVTSNVLIVDAIVDDGLQARLDERYGQGVVRVYAALQPRRS